MTKKTIHIEAIDTLFFRDGKPFSMGEDVWADGVFPPLPSVVYGALRSAFMFQKGLSVEKLEEQTENFRITNIYLLVGNEESDFLPALPFPYDLVKIKGQQYPMFLERVQCGTVSSDYSVLQSAAQEKAEDVHGKNILEKVAFEKYLRGNGKELTDMPLSKYLTLEPKIGIARDNLTRTTSGDAEGKMYRVGMQRMAAIDPKEFGNMHSLKIAVEFEGLDLENSGIFRYGGENKMVSYTTSPENTEIGISLDKIHSEVVKVYLATPAIFENGWCPQSFLNNEIDGIRFKLLAFSVGKPVYAGGFDMKEQKPKFMFKAVPAGSVYYLQAGSTDDAKKLAEKLIAQNHIEDAWDCKENNLITEAQKIQSQQAKSFAKQGFGKIYLGADKQN